VTLLAQTKRKHKKDHTYFTDDLTAITVKLVVHRRRPHQRLFSPTPPVLWGSGWTQMHCRIADAVVAAAPSHGVGQ
jgi:hypothetical protein